MYEVLSIQTIESRLTNERIVYLPIRTTLDNISNQSLLVKDVNKTQDIKTAVNQCTYYAVYEGRYFVE